MGPQCPPPAPPSFSLASSTGLDTGLGKPRLTALSPASHAAGPSQVSYVVTTEWAGVHQKTLSPSPEGQPGWRRLAIKQDKAH